MNRQNFFSIKQRYSPNPLRSIMVRIRNSLGNNRSVYWSHPLIFPSFQETSRVTVNQIYRSPVSASFLIDIAYGSPSSPTWPISAAADESLEGGSIVLTASKSKPSTVIEAEDDDGDGAATVTARTASATASSAWVGSKNVLGPTAMTRRVIGGRVAVEDAWGLVLGFVLVCGG